MSTFKGHIVLITGASGNLGSAAAHAFVEAGATLVLADRAKDRLREMFAGLDENAHLFLGGVDVTDENAVASMVKEAVDHFGRIDILINTVGGYRAGKPVHETELQTWDLMQNLNARSVFLVCRAVIPHMVARNSGSIVAIAAGAGLKGGAGNAAYSASKSSIIRLTESMSEELKHKGINVNCILPGIIDTPQNRKAMPNADTSGWVAPESLAGVILFLASEAAKDVHGAALPVMGAG